MKYFNNFPYSAESLKNEYRELCKKLHPDTGGNAEEFKIMSAEYEQIARNLNGTRQSNKAAKDLAEALRRAAERQRQEEEDRKEAEARRRREEEERREEERREAERIAKLQEESRAAVRAWAHILERIPSTVSGKKRAYDFEDKKAAAAYVAATKRNIKRVINHYFPGLEVKITISGEIWKEKFIISWEDGPTEDELQKIPELDFFVSSYYESDPYSDYGKHRERKGSAPWREAYGGSLGDCTRFETSRGLSEEGLQQAAEIAAKYFKNFDPANIWKHNERFKMSFSEWCDFMEFCGVEGRRWASFENMIQDYSNAEEDSAYYSSFRHWLTDHVKVSVIKKEKAPEFIPKYGPTYKAIKKALGGNAFAKLTPNEKTGENDWQALDIFAALLGDLSGLELCTSYEYDSAKRYSPIYFTSYTAERKRREKYAALGITIDGRKIKAISDELREALQKEFNDIEKQRQEWEAQQAAKKTGAKGSRKAAAESAAPETATETAAPAEGSAPAAGLELVDIAGGVAVVGPDTYKHRKAIKATGCKWNRDAKRWEATTPEAVAAVRAWFGVSEGVAEPETVTAAEPESAPAEDVAEPETVAAGQESNSATANASEEQQQAGELSPLFCALGDLLAIVADIMQQAQRWEGVTVPAETLTRWKQDTAAGTKTAAARFCEVCACLGSLTPESRRDFDALGAIFWSLSEQLKQGAAPETISSATEYARRQLFELISRTQTTNQARAVQEATDPDSVRRAA